MRKPYIGKVCPVCGIPFTENDEVYFCNMCGTPYHLSCWQNNQGCVTPNCPNNHPVYIPPSQMPTTQPLPTEALPVQPLPADPKPKRKKGKGGLIAILVASVVLIAALVCGAVFYVIPHYNYESACKALENGEYDSARQMFLDLDGYKDSAELADKALYQKAEDALKNGRYNEACQIFAGLDYDDSKKMVAESKYQQANAALNNGDYDTAIQIFENIVDYRDSCQMIVECNYRKACAMLNDGYYNDAIALFEEFPDYEDSEDKIMEAKYQQACAMLDKGFYDDAIALFDEIPYYKDSGDMGLEATYQKGCEYLDQRDYVAAVDIFKYMGYYKDGGDKANEAMYAYVKANMDNQDDTTYNYLRELKDNYYKDSATIYKDLYDWKIKIVAWNSDKDSKVNKSSISKYDPVYCHIELSGGTPDDESRIYVSGTLPNGEFFEFLFDENWEDGWYGWYGWEESIYVNPEYGASGTLKVSFFDDDNNLIGSGKLTITN